MRIKRYLAAALALVLGSGGEMRAQTAGKSADAGDLIARVHFVGFSQIYSDTNGAKLKAIQTLPQSEAVREEVMQKLATAPFRVMNKNSPARTNDHADLMRPLLQDALGAETYWEMRGPTNAWPEVMMAIKLENARAEIWRANLATVLNDWTGIAASDIQVGGFKGWELKKHHHPNIFRFIRAGDWVVFGWGQDELQLQAAMLQKIKDNKRPVAMEKKNWLDAWMDWPSFTAHHSSPFPFELPKMQLNVEGRGDYLRPELKLQFAEPLKLKVEPWQIPTNTICDPVASITFLRGFGPLLSQWPELTKLNAEPAPNQAIIWGLQNIPFEMSMVVPVPNAPEYLGRIGPPLVSLINSNLVEHSRSGRAEWSTNHEVLMRGYPLIAPFVRTTNESGVDYLLARAFVPPPRGKPFPWDKMMDSIMPTNVIFYSWELSGERMMQWIPLSQLYFISMYSMLPKADAPAQKWLTALKPELKTCATVATITGPNEVTVVRNSQVGFSGMELVWLALWLDGPGFPIEGGVQSSLPMKMPVSPK